jgi:hypothetical protein
MRTLAIALTIALLPAFAACQKQVEQTQADIKKGDPTDRPSVKAVQSASKAGEARNREQTEK